MATVEQAFLDPEYLTVAQAAKYLSMSAQTLRRWDDAGKLPSLRHPANGYRYYRRSDLERFRLEYKVAEAPSSKKSFPDLGPASILNNLRLREPQRQAYAAVAKHFTASTEHAIIQLPVGCGKTGVIAILPFGVAEGRVLVIAPNVTIRDGIAEALDLTAAKCFWRRTGVLDSFERGPYTAVLDGPEANIHDCVESHFVVTNIQQLASAADRWLPKFPPTFFDMILVDEGHHNAAPSWRKVFERFPRAKVVSLTATPFRGDQKQLAGDIIYRFPFTSAMAAGFIKKITATNVIPSEIYFKYRGEDRRHTLDEILELREEQWFSRGVALSEECNIHVVEESIAKLNAMRAGSDVRHQIIAAACSVDHARQIRSLYEQRGLRAREIHSDMPAEEQERVLESLRRGNLDCIVQVQMLGEGFDHPPLSVAAIFRPFRSLSPYIQFVGRIMRVNVEGDPDHVDNHGYVVSHVGLNNDTQWEDFRELDLADQELFRRWVRESQNAVSEREGQGRRFDVGMQVSQEILGEFVVNDPFLDLADDRVFERFLATPVSVSGLFGLTIADIATDRDALRARLIAAQPPRHVPAAQPTPVSPQRARQAGRKRLNERSKSVANRVLLELGLQPRGYNLMRVSRTGQQPNLEVVIGLIAREVNESLGCQPGSRDGLSREQVEQGLASLDAIGDRVRDRLRAQIEGV